MCCPPRRESIDGAARGVELSNLAGSAVLFGDDVHIKSVLQLPLGSPQWTPRTYLDANGAHTPASVVASTATLLECGAGPNVGARCCSLARR